MYFLLKKYGQSYKGFMFVRFDIILVKASYTKWNVYKKGNHWLTGRRQWQGMLTFFPYVKYLLSDTFHFVDNPWVQCNIFISPSVSRNSCAGWGLRTWHHRKHQTIAGCRMVTDCNSLCYGLHSVMSLPVPPSDAGISAYPHCKHYRLIDVTRTLIEH